ncbi:hypothetical protein MLD38_020788 [Melastoma candidum]|uniref:Uncharacterized protein n=1 Tax=Melastoma candidum TaxID=119954 RepID=A0ACB9QM45_9MYRT|nr:hypothetical protein MLD38_020788 [Melastoma candidum]
MMSSLRCHPTHGTPLRLEKKSYGVCDLCDGAIIGRSKVYQCEACRSCIHKRCVDAPATICHPFHPRHPLSLVHRSHPCSAANGTSRYVCGDCGYHVDLDWALCSLPDEGSVPPQPLEGKEEDLGMAHLHPLTPFSAKWGCKYCSVCDFPIEGYGHVCLSPGCEFIVHGGCLRYLRYNDGTWVTQVKHKHQLTTLDWTKTTGQRACNFCKLPIEGEYIGCRRCRLFYHRVCINVPGTLEHPIYPDSHLTLFVASTEHQEACQSCDCPLGGCLAYENEGEGLNLHTDCALRTLEYCKNGESEKIRSCLHEHEMFLCHRTAEKDVCSACEDKVTGLAYRCGHQGCSWLLHKSCLVAELKQVPHPFHPKHPITLVQENANFQHKCDACNEDIEGFYFRCTSCPFYLDLKCPIRWTFHIECALTDLFKGGDKIRYDQILAKLDKLLEETSTKVVDTETKIQELKEQHVKLSDRLTELREEREMVRSGQGECNLFEED